MKKRSLFLFIAILSTYNFSNNVIAKQKQETGNSATTIYIKEPLSMDKNGSSLGCNPYTEYYATGQIKEVGCQGYFEGQGTPLGTKYEYNNSGHLIKTTYYHPDKFGQDYKIVRKYDNSGKITSEEIFNNDALYEVDEKKLKKIPN